MSKCSIPECPKPVKARGWCYHHYMRWYNGMNTSSSEFLQVELHRVHSKQEYCNVEGCQFKHMRDGYCRRHWVRLNLLGYPKDSAEFLTLYPSKAFAKVLKRYPTVRINGVKQLIHIVKAEQVLGRKLKSDEMVHHVNGDKNNYRNNNLVVMYRWYHTMLFRQLHPWLYKEDD